MNSNAERRIIIPVDADRSIDQGNNVASVLNSSPSTVKIDSLCIKLGIVKEKADTQKCNHFSIRGYVAGMREKGSRNCLPFAEELPPMKVPNFRYWLCQRCLRNSGTANETALVSACDQNVVQRPCPTQDCNGVAVLPFGEGTSGVKGVDSRKGDESQSCKEIPPVAVCQELTNICPMDTNAAAEANGGTKESSDEDGDEDEDGRNDDNEDEETIASLVDYPKRKARKVRLLKELLCGKTKSQQQRKEKETCAPLAVAAAASSSLMKRKTLHEENQNQTQTQNQTQNQRSVDKKAKGVKGNAVAKTNMVEHSRDGEKSNKHEWHKHATQKSSILGKVGSDPVTAWRSIFNDTRRSDTNQVVPPGNGCGSGSRPTYNISKARSTEPSHSHPHPHPDKKTKKTVKSKFFEEDSSRRINVAPKSDTELGLGLSLSYGPQTLPPYPPFILSPTPYSDHTRKTGFSFGQSSTDSLSKEASFHNRHPPRTAFIQEQQRPCSYSHLSYGNASASASAHQKLDFTDPYKRNNRGYSDVMGPPQNHNNNHHRQENMFSIGRSDEREVIELMAKNQYERNLSYEARNQRRPPGGNYNRTIPNSSGFHNTNEHFSMSRPSSSSSSISPSATAGFYSQRQVSDFSRLDTSSQKQPSSGIWASDYNSQHASPVINDYSYRRLPPMYVPTNEEVIEAFTKYMNEKASSTNMSFGQKPYKDNTSKGKSVMDLDLNVVAPNVVEDHNKSTSMEKQISSLDSSYSNEAIPAMQLLSLMDAGKSRKFIPPKPLSPCYNHNHAKTNSTSVPYHGQSSRSFISSPENSSSYALGGFRNNQNVKLPLSHDKPREEDSPSRLFPLPWHPMEDPVTNGGTEICTINRNPADFTTPGPENAYMINGEDLILIGEACYKGKSAAGPKWQTR